MPTCTLSTRMSRRHRLTPRQLTFPRCLIYLALRSGHLAISAPCRFVLSKLGSTLPAMLVGAEMSLCTNLPRRLPMRCRSRNRTIAHLPSPHFPPSLLCGRRSFLTVASYLSLSQHLLSRAAPTMSRTTFLSAVTLGLSAIASADIYPNYEYGNMFYLGPTTRGQYITKATYSLRTRAAHRLRRNGCRLKLAVPLDWATG